MLQSYHQTHWKIFTRSAVWHIDQNYCQWILVKWWQHVSDHGLLQSKLTKSSDQVIIGRILKHWNCRYLWYRRNKRKRKTWKDSTETRVENAGMESAGKVTKVENADVMIQADLLISLTDRNSSSKKYLLLQQLQTAVTIYRTKK